jgi:hypothetical protein
MAIAPKRYGDVDVDRGLAPKHKVAIEGGTHGKRAAEDRSMRKPLYYERMRSN